MGDHKYDPSLCQKRGVWVNTSTDDDGNLPDFVANTDKGTGTKDKEVDVGATAFTDSKFDWVGEILGDVGQAIELDDQNINIKSAGSVYYFPENLSHDSNFATVIFVPFDSSEGMCEIEVYRDRKMIQIFQLLEYGRKLYRLAAYASDVRFSLTDMDITSFGDFGAKPVNNLPCPSVAHGGWRLDGSSSLDTSGKSLSVIKDGRHFHVTSELLHGTIPDALVVNYEWWYTDHSIPLKGKNDSLIPDKSLLPKKYPTPNVDIMSGIPIPNNAHHIDYAVEMWVPASRDRPNRSVEGSYVRRVNDMNQTEEWLLDLTNVPKDNLLYNLITVLTRLDNLSYILAWTKPKPIVKFGSAEEAAAFKADDITNSITDPQDIGVIEFPRIRCRFEPKKSLDGQLRFYSVDYNEYFISDKHHTSNNDNLRNLMIGLPTAILLESLAGSFKILMPSFFPYGFIVKKLPYQNNIMFPKLDVKWLMCMTSKHFVYDVHSSQSFVVAPNLAGSLYILMVRLMQKDYEGCMKLVDACQSDMPPNQEEEIIIKHIIDECYPDTRHYHASVMLKLGLKFMHCYPGDRREERIGKYIITTGNYVDEYFKRKYQSHLPTWALLTANEERLLSDKYFNQMSAAEAPLTTMIEDSMNGQHSEQCVSFGMMDGPADFEQILVSIARDIKSGYVMSEIFKKLEDAKKRNCFFLVQRFTYQRPHMRNDLETMEVLNNCYEDTWQGANGASYHLGFFFIYELLTGSLKIKLVNKDVSKLMGQKMMYLKYLHEEYVFESTSNESFLLFNLLWIVSANPKRRWPSIDKYLPGLAAQRGMVPQFYFDDKRNGEGKGMLEFFETLIKECCTDGLPTLLGWDKTYVSPFLAKDLHDVEKEEMKHAEGRFFNQNIGKHCELVAFLNSSNITQIQSDCTERSLASRAVIDSFSGTNPLLNDAGLDVLVTQTDRSNERPPPKSPLPFTNISKHRLAQSKISKDMLARWDHDLQQFHTQGVRNQILALKGLDEQGVDSTSDSAIQLVVQDVLDCLLEFKDIEITRQSALLSTIAELADQCIVEDATSDADRIARRVFLLKREHSGGALLSWHEMRCRSLMSSEFPKEVRKFNPFLTDQECAQLEGLISEMMLVGNRLVLVGACVEIAYRLAECSTRRQACIDAPPGSALSALLTDTGKDLSQAVFELAERLYTQRWYIDTNGKYDPRFLCFEYSFDMVLRKRQVEIVHEIVDEAMGDKSAVHQMIMGAGKTTGGYKVDDVS